MRFAISHSSGRARAGTLELPRGTILATPVFMPVATQATVKALSSKDLETLDVGMILCNAYHLHLRPGENVIAEAQGLHRFMSWPGGIITDSGGFQVFSLADLRKITSAGVEFSSPWDGSRHYFTPESNMQLQHALGADIIMALDECVGYPAQPREIRAAVERTTAWARRCLAAHASLGGDQVLFGIVQGGVDRSARATSARQIAELDFPGFGIGGLSVGEGSDKLWEMLEVLDPILPEEKPRYLMGVGTPLDVWEAVGWGVDMLDCAMPTRIARNGTLFTSRGRLVVKNAACAKDPRPPDPECRCPLCSRYSRAYLRHLFHAQELTAFRLSTLHNVWFMLHLMNFIRESIVAGNFQAAKLEFTRKYSNGEGEISV